MGLFRSKGADAAEAAIIREGMFAPRQGREAAIRRLRDNVASQRGSGRGGWTDRDVDDYVDTCNDQLYGGE